MTYNYDANQSKSRQTHAIILFTYNTVGYKNFYVTPIFPVLSSFTNAFCSRNIFFYEFNKVPLILLYSRYCIIQKYLFK